MTNIELSLFYMLLHILFFREQEGLYVGKLEVMEWKESATGAGCILYWACRYFQNMQYLYLFIYFLMECSILHPSLWNKVHKLWNISSFGSLSLTRKGPYVPF